MLLHFYTSWDNIESLEKGEIVKVWNNFEARATDIHISLDTNNYIITKTNTHRVFNAQKVTWKVE